jgi:hypothetical protein
VGRVNADIEQYLDRLDHDRLVAPGTANTVGKFNGRPTIFSRRCIAPGAGVMARAMNNIRASRRGQEPWRR